MLRFPAGKQENRKAENQGNSLKIAHEIGSGFST
jgi:hypothetical protein